MPHSSGGGSHRGGSHHGGSRSSRTGLSSRYYEGASRYVFYKDNRPEYFFLDKDPSALNKLTFVKSLIFSLVLLVLFLFEFISSFSIPKKLNINYNSNIIIDDSLNVLSDTEENELRTIFLQFQKDTGITPSFIKD